MQLVDFLSLRGRIRLVIMALLAAVLASASAGSGMAQTQGAIVAGEGVAAGPASLRVGETLVQLWGLRAPEPGRRCLIEGELEDCAASGLSLMQDSLDRNARVQCEVVSRTATAVVAKCFQVEQECYGATCNERLDDLAAEQVSTGMAIPDRAVTGAAYDEQEDLARYGLQGLWGEPHGGGLLPPAAVDEGGFVGDIGGPELKVVGDLLKAYCHLGGPVAPSVQAGHAAIAEAGYTVETGNPEASVKAAGLEIYLGRSPGPHACSFRILRRSLSAETLDAWAGALSERFKKTGARSYEAGRGVTHFAAETGFGRQTLIVNRRGSEIEFTLSRAL